MGLEYCTTPFIVRPGFEKQQEPESCDPGELTVDYSPQLFDDYGFIARYSFDYDRKEIHFYLASLKFRFKLLTAQALYESSQLPAQLSNAFDFDHKSQIAIIIPFDSIFIDLFGQQARAIDVKLTLKNFSEPKVEIAPNFSLELPYVKQKEMETLEMMSEMPDKVVQHMYRHEFDASKMSAKELEIYAQLEEFKKAKVEDRFRKHGYADMLNIYLDIEKCEELKQLRKYSMNNVVLEPFDDFYDRFIIRTRRQIPEHVNSIKLIPMNIYYVYKRTPETQKIIATIKENHEKHVVIAIKSDDDMVQFGRKYRLELVPNLFSTTMAKQALKRIREGGFENYMINFETAESLHRDASRSWSLEWLISSMKSLLNSRLGTVQDEKKFQDADFQWLNTQIGNNPAHMKAIKSIVNRTSFPSPFVVYGGPGCGKTSLAVEAVAQIVKLLPEAKILVTTNSNSACDEIGERLLNFIGPYQMYRLYSLSCASRKDEMSKKLVPFSNLRSNESMRPSIEEIKNYNVVLSTLVSSGRLSKIPPHYFDFIFVDECASVAEPFVNIPISLAVPNLKASIVFLGDPKQLGPTVKCFQLERYGFNISMMERIMELEKYKYKEQAGYDPNYIVQLTDNFRSHKSIIEFSNEEFYNSRLVSRQKEEIANFAIGWKHLPNKDYPVMFVSSWTPSREKKGCTSLVNYGEISLVKKYVYKLLKEGINGKKVSPSDIGIISPYTAQRDLLKKALGEELEVGSVEYFQGREKLIIILSCVRSKTMTVGFLKNEKRLNVALTRAKALQIVIGNPETLGKNKLWRKLLTMCHFKKAVKGNIPLWVIKKTTKELEDDSDTMASVEEIMDETALDD